MINFSYIYINGFGSIGNNLSYQLNKPGINVLNAANGTGKTTIFSAWAWCLFGKSLKNKSSVVTWKDKQPEGYKGCKVETYFKVGLEDVGVIRCEDYKEEVLGVKGSNRLILLINGKEQNQYRDKKDVQAAILKILGFSFDLFKNSVIFGQKMKRLIEEDGPTKKAIFEEIFETDYLQKAKEEAEEKRKELQIELNQVQQVIINKSASLKQNQIDRERVSLTINNFDRQKEIDLQKATDKWNELGKEINIARLKEFHLIKNIDGLKLQKRLTTLRKLEQGVKEKGNEHFRLEMSIIQTDGEIKGEKDLQKALMMNKPKTVCQFCSQKISTQLIQKQRREQTKFIEESKIKAKVLANNLKDLKAAQVKIAEFLEKNKNLQAIIKDILDKIQLEQTKTIELKALGDKIKYLNKDYHWQEGVIKDIEKRKCIYELQPIEDRIKKLKTYIALQSIRLNQINQDYEIQDWLIKDPFSNSGIKAYIFNQMIQVVNERLQEYGSIIGRVIHFGMDMESGNKDFYITIENNKQIRFYQDLSGGEQQLVNVCIAFAVHDVISQTKDVNILVADEIFENLDPNNIDIVSSLIQQKSKGKSLHIITHHTSFMPTNANFISLYNKKGLTYKR